MNDYTLAIKIVTEGGKVVVKDLGDIGTAADKANAELNTTGKRGKTAAEGLDKTAREAKKAEDKLTAAAGAAVNINLKLMGVERSGRGASASLRQTGNSAKAMATDINVGSNAMANMVRHAHLMIGGFVGLQGLRTGLHMADDFNVLEQRIKTATAETGDFNEVNKELRSIAMENGAALAGTVALFQRMSQGRKELQASNEQMLEFTDTVQKLGVIGGSNQEAMKYGLTQLSQAMSGNVFRAEEYNSLIENIPEVVNRIAKGFDKTKGELRTMLLDGRLMSKDVFETLLKQSMEIDQQFGNIELSMQRAGSQFETALGGALTQLDDAWQLTGGLAAFLHDAAQTLSNMDASELQDMAALIAGGLGFATALLLANRFKLGLTGIYSESIKAYRGLTTTNIQMNAFGQVTNRATLATRTFTAAATAARGALALMGGPVGVALLAAYAIYEYTRSSEQALEPTKSLAEQVAGLSTEYEKLTKAQKENARIKLNARIGEIESEITRLQTLLAIRKDVAGLSNGQLANLADTLGLKTDDLAGAGEAAVATQAKIDGLRQEITKLKSSLTDLNKPVKENKDTTSELSKEYEKLLEFIDPSRKAFNTYTAQVAILTKELDAGRISMGEYIMLAQQLDKIYADKDQKADDKENRALEKQAEQLESLIDQVDNFGGAWSNTGSIIADTFGSIADVLNDYSGELNSIEKLTDKLNEKQAEYKEGTDEYLQIEQAKMRLQEQGVQANLRGYSQLAGAASKMFGEQSKGREALHNAEMVFGAIETAMALKKAAANALNAISIAYSAPFPINFAAGAAMIGIMSGLGLFNGSSGGSYQSAEDIQANQGTGSVLGDSGAKSNSIGNGWDRFEDIQIDQLGELRGIRESIRSLNSGIAQLAQTVVRGIDLNAGYSGQLGSSDLNFGSAGAGLAGGAFLGGSAIAAGAPLLGLTGILSATGIGAVAALAVDKLTGGLISGILSGISSKKRELIDSGISFSQQTLGQIFESGELEASLYQTIKTTKKKFWGLSKSERTDREYSSIDSAINEQMTAIFGHISDSVVGAAHSLGFETIDVTTTTITRLFDEFNPDNLKYGAGRFVERITTTTTKTLEEALESYRVNIGDISLDGLSGDEIQAELEAVFSQQADLIAEYLVPAIGDYQQIGEGAYDTLLRVAHEQAVFNDALDKMGISLGDLSNVMQIDVAQSIIGLVGGFDKFNDLTNSYFSEFFSESEQFAYLTDSISDVFAQLGVSLPDSKEGFRDLITGIDITTEAGEQLYAALLELNPALAQYYDLLKQQKDAANERNVYEADIADALKRMDYSDLQASLVNLESWYQEQIEQAEALGADTTLLEQLYARKRAEIVDQALGDINEDTQRKLDALISEHDSAVDKLTGNYDQLINAISQLSGAIGGSILDIRRQMAGWDEVTYQNDQIDVFTGQLGQGSVDDQIGNIQQLYNAIYARYQAEMSANDALQRAAEERYQSELSAYESLTDAANNLRNLADSIAVGGLSPLTQKEQLDLAAKLFRTSSVDNRENTGKDYLSIAQNYYGTGSAEYETIFEQVQSSFRSATAGASPVAPPEVIAYQQADQQLQQKAIDELSDLQLLLGDLQQQATDELSASVAELTAQLELSQQEIVDAAQQQVNELANLASAISNLPPPIVTVNVTVETPAVPAPVEPVRPPTPERISGGNDDVVAAIARLEKIQRENTNELRRTQDEIITIKAVGNV